MHVKLKINNYEHRRDIVFGLYSEGYKVWLERERTNPWSITNYDYYVCFEYMDDVKKEK